MKYVSKNHALVPAYNYRTSFFAFTFNIMRESPLLNKRTLFFILFFSVSAKRLALGQNSYASNNSFPKKKGSLYLTWGYNRDWYSKSDIHFVNNKTDNYDFTLKSVNAQESPSMEKFWQPSRLTIPQYNLHVGYLFNDKHDLGIEISWDHLKYVMTNNQTVFVQGNIRGKTINKDTLVTPGFVQLEHTDGNNYLLFNLVKKKKLLVIKNFQVSALAKLGTGPLISYTHSTVFGSSGRGPFLYEGWVTGISLGIRLNIYRYLFIQTDMQGAFANYTNIKLGADKQGYATQQFYSLQYMWAVGVNLPLRS